MLVHKGGVRLLNEGHNSSDMLNTFKPSSEFYFTERSKAVLLLWILFVIYVLRLPYYTVLSVPCSLVIICWEGLTSWLSSVWCFPVCFFTFPYGVSGQVCTFLYRFLIFAFFFTYMY